MKRIGIVTSAAVVLEIASPFGLAHASAATVVSSGTVYVLTTGPYYPSWYADNCLKANIASNLSAQSYSHSSVDPGGCSGGANMQPGWIGVDAQEYKNGSFCGQTGWAYNDSATTDFGVGSGGDMCSGSGNLRTNALGQWWDYIYTVWQYTSPINVSSPYESV